MSNLIRTGFALVEQLDDVVGTNLGPVLGRVVVRREGHRDREQRRQLVRLQELIVCFEFRFGTTTASSFVAAETNRRSLGSFARK